MTKTIENCLNCVLDGQCYECYILSGQEDKDIKAHIEKITLEKHLDLITKIKASPIYPAYRARMVAINRLRRRGVFTVADQIEFIDRALLEFAEKA